MPQVLCSDGIVVDDWPFSAGDRVTSAASADLRELLAGGTRRLLAAARLTPAQILRLCARPKRWLAFRRCGRRLLTLGLADLAARLELGERELVWCLQRCDSRDAFLARVFRRSPPPPLSQAGQREHGAS